MPTVWKNCLRGGKPPSNAIACLRKVVKWNKLSKWDEILFDKFYSNKTSYPRGGDSQSEQKFKPERLTIPVATAAMMKSTKRNNTPLECREFSQKNEFAYEGAKSIQKEIIGIKTQIH